MSERLLARMESYYPSLRKEIVEYEAISDYELIVVLIEGGRFIFDSMDGTIRRLPSRSHAPNDEDYKREFGFRLKKMLYRKGMTMTELSAKTGITQPQISNYINGRNSPSFYKVEKIADVLGCSLDDLRYR